MQYKNMRLYHNMGESKQYVKSEEFINVGPVNEELVVGSDGDHFFKGKYLGTHILGWSVRS